MVLWKVLQKLPVGFFPHAFGLGGAVARNALPQSRRAAGQRERVGDALKVAAGPWARRIQGCDSAGTAAGCHSAPLNAV